MHEIILSIVCIACWVGVLGYVFFSNPKSKIAKQEVLFNADVTWGGPDAEEVFESLRKSNVKATFKGNHRI